MTMCTTPPIEIFVPGPADHLDALPTKHHPNYDRCRCIDPPSTLPHTIDKRPDEQDDGELHAAERTKGFAVDGARVKGTGKVAFAEVEDERDDCGTRSDKDRGERSGRVVMCRE